MNREAVSQTEREFGAEFARQPRQEALEQGPEVVIETVTGDLEIADAARACARR